MPDGTPARPAERPRDLWVEGSPRLHAVEWHAVEWHAAESHPGESRAERAPTVLLLHGANQHARYWDRFAALLTGYRVVALDTRGHGASERAPDGRYGVEEYVADLERVIDALAGDSAIALVGHSTGALVGEVYASRHPERLWAAVFIDIDPRPPDRQRERLREAGERSPRRLDTREEVVALVERMTPGLPADAVATLVEAGYQLAEDGRYESRLDPQTLAQFPQFDNVPLLPSITAPAMAVRGADSTVSSEEGARTAAEALPRGVLAIVPGEHQLHVQRPAELAAAVLPFLAEHAPSASAGE
jgi:pimeloyl-ACP methyl ester carboxylesterase